MNGHICTRYLKISQFIGLFKYSRGSPFLWKKKFHYRHKEIRYWNRVKYSHVKFTNLKCAHIRSFLNWHFLILTAEIILCKNNKFRSFRFKVYKSTLHPFRLSQIKYSLQFNVVYSLQFLFYSRSVKWNSLFRNCFRIWFTFRQLSSWIRKHLLVYVVHTHCLCFFKENSYEILLLISSYLSV
jgi:hypothetical protein